MDKKRWKKYLELSSKYDNLSFCFVAGHEAYKIKKEIPTSRAFHEFISSLDGKRNQLVFMGIENLSTKFVQSINTKYDNIIPILLNGDKRLLTNNTDNSLLGDQIAVYSPFVTGIQEHSILMENSYKYLIRRKYTQNLLVKTKNWNDKMYDLEWQDYSIDKEEILKLSLDKLILTETNIKRHLSIFKLHNVQIVIGFPFLTKNITQEIKNFFAMINPPFIQRKTLKAKVESGF